MREVPVAKDNPFNRWPWESTVFNLQYQQFPFLKLNLLFIHMNIKREGNNSFVQIAIRN